jgi:predicted RNA-binding Zn-ribbon protein involved in translation (DUF1610 family)
MKKNKLTKDEVNNIFEAIKKESPSDYSELIKCPHCDKEISSSASSCPHCGNTFAYRPRCPTCNSGNIEKISTAKKAAYVAGFGILAPAFKKVRSQFQCKNCGYKW